MRPDPEFLGTDGGMGGMHAAGHIAGAKQLTWNALVGADGRFLPREQLQAKLDGAGATSGQAGGGVLHGRHARVGRVLRRAPPRIRRQAVRRIDRRLDDEEAAGRRRTGRRRAGDGGQVGCIMSKSKLDLLQGTLDLLILKTLALGPMHGWGISQRIQQISEDVLRVNQGSLYPALHRLEAAGWIDAEWGASENNRQAKFYRLTKTGQTPAARRDRAVGAHGRRGGAHSGGRGSSERSDRSARQLDDHVRSGSGTKARALRDGAGMDRELDAEVRFHIEMETQKYIRQGDDARRGARRRH